MFGQTRTGRVEDVLGFEFGGLSCSGMAPARFTGLQRVYLRSVAFRFTINSALSLRSLSFHLFFHERIKKPVTTESRGRKAELHVTPVFFADRPQPKRHQTFRRGTKEKQANTPLLIIDTRNSYSRHQT